MAPSSLLPGLRRAAEIVADLRERVDRNKPMSSYETLNYAIALGKIEDEIRALESTAPTADEAPEAVLDGGDDDGERTLGRRRFGGARGTQV